MRNMISFATVRGSVAIPVTTARMAGIRAMRMIRSGFNDINLSPSVDRRKKVAGVAESRTESYQHDPPFGASVHRASHATEDTWRSAATRSTMHFTPSRTSGMASSRGNTGMSLHEADALPNARGTPVAPSSAQRHALHQLADRNMIKAL